MWIEMGASHEKRTVALLHQNGLGVCVRLLLTDPRGGRQQLPPQARPTGRQARRGVRGCRRGEGEQGDGRERQAQAIEGAKG